MNGSDLSYGHSAIFHYGTYASRCSRCGEITTPIDAGHPDQLRICLACLIKAVDAVTVEELDYRRDADDEVYEAQRDARVYEDTIVELRESIVELESKNTERTQLVESMQATIDDLQAEIDSHGDDGAAVRNKIALLEQDVAKWRALATRKIDITS